MTTTFYQPFSTEAINVATSRAVNLQAGELGKVFYVDTSGGAVTITLPEHSEINAGVWFRLIKIVADPGNASFDFAGSDYYNGDVAQTIASVTPQNAGVLAISSGGPNWSVFLCGESGGPPG